MNPTNPKLPDELLSAYLDGELDSQDQQRVVDALETNEDARRILAELTQIRADLRNLPRHTLPAAFTDRVLDRCANDARSPAVGRPSGAAPVRRPSFNRNQLAWWSLAGCLLIAALVTMRPTPDAPQVAVENRRQELAQPPSTAEQPAASESAVAPQNFGLAGVDQAKATTDSVEEEFAADDSSVTSREPTDSSRLLRVPSPKSESVGGTEPSLAAEASRPSLQYNDADETLPAEAAAPPSSGRAAAAVKSTAKADAQFYWRSVDQGQWAVKAESGDSIASIVKVTLPPNDLERVIRDYRLNDADSGRTTTTVNPILAAATRAPMRVRELEPNLAQTSLALLPNSRMLVLNGTEAEISQQIETLATFAAKTEELDSVAKTRMLNEQLAITVNQVDGRPRYLRSSDALASDSQQLPNKLDVVSDRATANGVASSSPAPGFGGAAVSEARMQQRVATTPTEDTPFSPQRLAKSAIQAAPGRGQAKSAAQAARYEVIVILEPSN